MALRCEDGTVTGDFPNELPNFHIDTFSELHNIFVTGILQSVTTLIALFSCSEMNLNKAVFYVGISPVSNK